MQRMQKQGGEAEITQRSAQTRFTSRSRENEQAGSIDDSPAMVAQRKKLQSLFGGAIQRVDDEEPLQGKFDAVQRIEEGSLQGKSEALQKKSRVETYGQSFNWEDGNTIVGKSMKAWLEPGSLLQGESANINTDQNPMMEAIRDRYGIVGGDLVKGHLLNDNLGGKALNNNLFPITRAANKQHLLTTENWAKDTLWTQQKPLWYMVDVIGSANIDTGQHAFRVRLGEWGGGTDYTSKNMGDVEVSGDITSDLGEPRDSETANGDEMDTFSAETLKKATQSGMALVPRKNVGDMSEGEQAARDLSGKITNTLDSEGDKFLYK